MEASALHAPSTRTRISRSAGASFLRLRSDEQLVELFRAGHEDAFRVIHDRYRARLFAYTRQMLPGSRQDAEDALQDVFIRAYSGLRANDRQLALRAWLYRVAHNRCVDQLRKNMPLLTEEIEVTSREVSTDPMAAVQQREDLRKLVDDVQRLPDQQRSALLMRELSGMSYQELADSLELSVPAIKSLLVRARVGLAAAAEARNTDCGQIRTEIVDSHERGARPNALTRRHLTDCASCREYRESVRGVSKGLAALVPAGPLLLAVKYLGIGSVYHAAAYTGATATGTAAASAGGAAAAGAGGAAAAGAAGAAGASAAAGAAGAGASAAAAGGAAAAAGAAGAGGAAAGAGGVLATSGAIAGGVTATHIVAIAAVAAVTGGAVAVSSTSTTPRHATPPPVAASSVISHAVTHAANNGYSPANAVTPVTPLATPATATSANSAAAGVIQLKKQPATTTKTPPTAVTTTTAAPVATTTTPVATTPATTTTPAATTTSTTAATGTATTAGSETTTTPASTNTTASGATTTAPAASTTPSSSASTTTPARPASTSGATSTPAPAPSTTPTS